MSTAYKFNEPITRDKFEEVLREIGVSEQITDDTTIDRFCVGNDKDYMWCYPTEDGMVMKFCRYGSSYDAEDFLQYVADRMDLTLYSEHDDEYWI